jgi:signal transduction histidine kinase
MTTIRDMSYWLELEQQKTISSLKTIAFASAAHEFRNPLNGILSSLQLLKDKVDLSSCGTYYSTALDCTNLMLYLVKDILDFS